MENKNSELKQQYEEKARQVMEKKKKLEVVRKELEDTKNQAAQDLTAKSEQVIHLTTEHMKEKERLEAIVQREPDK